LDNLGYLFSGEGELEFVRANQYFSDIFGVKINKIFCEL
jgi:hypothetical protein